MKKIFLVLILLFVHWPVYSQIDTKPLEEVRKQREINRKEAQKSKKVVAQCRFDLIVKVAPKLGREVPPKIKNQKVWREGESLPFMKMTDTILGGVLVIPGFLPLLPFAIIGDILAAPFQGVKYLVDKHRKKIKSDKSNEEIVDETIAYKKQWEKIEPNRFRRHILINELYVLQFLEDSHKWLIEGVSSYYGPSYTGKNSENYDFIMPQIAKALGTKVTFNKLTNSWRIKNPHKATYQEMDLFFYPESFVKILEENPKLCTSPGLDALDIIGNGYAKIINKEFDAYKRQPPGKFFGE